MTFGLDISEVIQAIGVLGVALIVFAESGLLIGFFLPGDTLLFAAGLLTHQGAISMNIHLFVFITFIAAILGDNVGYYFGKKVGPRIFKREDSLLFHKENIVRAQKFYEKFGAITVTIARFVPVVRTFAPIVAGVGHMDYKKFAFYNILGAAIWTGSIMYLGYFSGEYLEKAGIEIDHLVYPVIIAVTVLTLLSPLVHILRDKKSRSIFLKRLGFKTGE